MRISPAARLVFAALLACLAGCRFQSHRAAYATPAGQRHADLKASLDADARGSSRRYASSAQAAFTFSAADSARGLELAFAVDTLAFAGSDRDSGEDRYMAERLRKYRARLLVARDGRILSLEEEPVLPSVDFTPLNFGRWLLYAWPAFPAEDIGNGSRWIIEQPLLDKFHPESKVVKSYQATGTRKTDQGLLLNLRVEVAVHLDDLDDARDSQGPALIGKGEVVFNLDRGEPVSVELEMEGAFRIPSPSAGDSTAAPEPRPIKLKERFRLAFRA